MHGTILYDLYTLSQRVRVPIDDEQDEKDESEDEDDEQEVENKQELCTRCSQKLLKFVEKQLGQSGNHLKVVLGKLD